MNRLIQNLLKATALGFLFVVSGVQAEMRVCGWAGPGKFYTHGAGRYCMRTVACTSPSGRQPNIVQDYACRASACDSIQLCGGDDSIGTMNFYEDYLKGRVEEEVAVSYESRHGQDSWPTSNCNCSTSTSTPTSLPTPSSGVPASEVSQ